MNEPTWLPVPGFRGDYDVSDQGEVRSHKRGRTRLLKAALNPQGYLVVYLYLDAVLYRRPVHSLVALTFHGPRPECWQTRHLDGNPLNNSAENLAYGTRSENVQDCLRHGTHYQASKTHCKWGHPFDEVNTRFVQGRRVCRECARRNLRASRARRAG